MAQIIDGRLVAAEIREEISEDVSAWTAAGNRPPYLAVVLVGDNPASASYVRGKTKAAAEAGIDSDTLTYPTDMTEGELLELIGRLNNDDSVDGILVQLPLPDHIEERKIIRAIEPGKDVDGLHPENVGLVSGGDGGFPSCTPAGVVEILRRSSIPISGKHAVIVGRSNLVGKPLATLLIQKGVDATVTICHSRTPDLSAMTRQADILVAAIGRAHLIKADMIKPGAAVIDVGVNRLDDPTRERGYRLVGDVDFEAASDVAGYITPVPGGVGPMTIAMLLKNTFRAATKRAVGVSG